MAIWELEWFSELSLLGQMTRSFTCLHDQSLGMVTQAGCSPQGRWLLTARAVWEGTENRRSSNESAPRAKTTSSPLRGIWVERPSVPHKSLTEPKENHHHGRLGASEDTMMAKSWSHSDHMLFSIGFQYLLVENLIEKKHRKWCRILNKHNGSLTQGKTWREQGKPHLKLNDFWNSSLLSLLDKTTWFSILQGTFLLFCSNLLSFVSSVGKPQLREETPTFWTLL